MGAMNNLMKAVLILAIVAGIAYMIDPTLGGLLGAKHEGFYAEAAAAAAAAPSMAGMPAGAMQNAGAEDEKKIKEAAHAVENFKDAMKKAAAAVKEKFEDAPKGAEKKPGVEGFENLEGAPMPFDGAQAPANCYPKQQLAPQDLLPNDPNSKWAQVNPMGAGDIAGKNFLSAGALIGIDTVGQSLRNASWDIRSAPANPQAEVGPWMQSTITPDLSRRPLE